MSGKRKKGTSNGQGGYRPGSGRKKRKEKYMPYSFDITESQIDMLRLWGGGDASAGLRWLIAGAILFVRFVPYRGSKE